MGDKIGEVLRESAAIIGGWGSYNLLCPRPSFPPIQPALPLPPPPTRYWESHGRQIEENCHFFAQTVLSKEESVWRHKFIFTGPLFHPFLFFVFTFFFLIFNIFYISLPRLLHFSFLSPTFLSLIFNIYLPYLHPFSSSVSTFPFLV